MIKDIKIGDMIGLHHKVIKICGGEGKSSFGIVLIRISPRTEGCLNTP